MRCNFYKYLAVTQRLNVETVSLSIFVTFCEKSRENRQSDEIENLNGISVCFCFFLRKNLRKNANENLSLLL